jgi:membrane fusion protein (multidrug efflux system)
VKPPKKSVLKPLLLIVLLAAAVYFGVPAVQKALTVVSTDDAYVNGHVTFVAPRVGGQVARVLVDDNRRVRKGDLLVELDKEPYRLIEETKQAALDAARADEAAAEASVRASVARARSLRYRLQHAMEDVNSQAALLRARVAALEQTKAARELAQTEFDRAKSLRATNAVSQQDLDQRNEALLSAQAQYNSALQNIYETRVNLGLPPQPPSGKDLAAVPTDLDQTFSSVRQAQLELLQAASQLAIVPSSYDLKPKEMLEEFLKRDPEGQGNIDRIYAELIKNAPAMKQANTKVLEARRDLEQAQLNLRYCEVRAEIDGVVTRRNVNPGNNVQAGQSLMAVRSLSEIWVDANFKETQLRDLRIGLPVDLRVDMYGKRRVFHGRISGFTMGTGSTLALLPAQNATGNFIKVVQRLPVRIEFTDYNPEKDALFVGTSVVPEVRIKEAPSGPNAGKYIQPYESTSTTKVPAASTKKPLPKP